jgi:ABC-type polysaccharide/polyol phosphate transport system ATPase subunit
VKKCEERIDQLLAQGTTLLLVSHLADAVRAHCRRCVWLDGGRIRADGSPDDILALYEGDATVGVGPDGVTVSA